MHGKRIFFALAAVALILGTAAALAAPQSQRPPEYREIMAAQNISDLAARLKELERIKAAYPQSPLRPMLEEAILVTKVKMCAALDEVLALQKTVVGQGEGFDRIYSYFAAAMDILHHPNLARFDAAGVVQAVVSYRNGADRLLKEEAFIRSVPEEERPYLFEYGNNINVVAALACVNAGEPSRALDFLKVYRSAGGAEDDAYSYASAEASVKLGKNEDALGGYLAAAVENYRDAEAKARDLWATVKGTPEGFEAALEIRQRALPFHPEAFAVPADWKGKTVLAEIFTGSECPPCAGADLGFDGLIESVPETHLAILEYHLPIPRPDPMINPATRARQQYYGVNSTPSTFFDGARKASGGGGRAGAEGKYKEYLAEIKSLLKEEPAVSFTVKAVRDGDEVAVDVNAEKNAAGAETFAALVEKEVRFKGGNGIVFHKMVVRDFQAVSPENPRVVFDLAASEQTTDAYLTEFEKTYDRIPNYKFAERRNGIGREGLRVVVFAQDKPTKKVLNAAAADIK